VLSGRGLGDELITRPEESYRLWSVVVCDLETSRMRKAITRVGSQRHSKRKDKGKAFPLQAWTGPEGSRRLRLPDFKTIGT